MTNLTIARLADAADVGVETVRYYQRRGLLDVPARGAGIRRYGPTDVQRLRFIRSAQAAGFTLEEIRELLAFDPVNDRPSIRALAEGRIAALNDQIRLLQGARAALSRLAKQCGSGDSGPCPIVDAFDT